jgi:hypothetical protein
MTPYITNHIINDLNFVIRGSNQVLQFPCRYLPFNKSIDENY